MPLPHSQHDWAIWLFEHLEGVTAWTDTQYRGRLPEFFDFNEIDGGLAETASAVRGVTDAVTREIEFHPESGHVYLDMDRLLANPKNRESSPLHFTLRSIGYTAGGDQTQPESVKYYVAATRLWALVKEMADYHQDSGNIQNFIESYESKIAIRLAYGSSDLRRLGDLNSFIREFRETDTHKQQKRNIFRTVLIDLFKGRGSVRLADLLVDFDDFVENARNSYSMYAADFSFEKVVEAVDRQNLEDTLRLNKVLSDLQNQLLALPAALIFAGASLESGHIFQNIAVVLGVLMFVVFMWLLVANQLNSLEAIGNEIDIRQSKLRELPARVSERFKKSFNDLESRKSRQCKVLEGIRFSAVAVFLLILLMAWCS